MVATVELGHVSTPQKLVSTATIAISVVASQLVALISGGDRSFWCVLSSSWNLLINTKIFKVHCVHICVFVHLRMMCYLN